jgi:hypothetical protein
MAEKERTYPGLTPEELDDAGIEELPERSALSLINANLAVPVNAVVAANVLSDHAAADADAVQDVPVDETG